MAAEILTVALGIFAIGVVAGIVAVVSLGVSREDRGILGVSGPDNLSRGVRRLTGLYVKSDDDSTNTHEDMLV